MENIIVLIVFVIVGIFYFKRASSNIMASDIPAKSKFQYSGKDFFTYDELRAESPKDIAVDKGETKQNDFLAAFNSFPWDEQIEVSNNLKIQSPTLSVHDHLRNQTIFVSMCGSKTDGVGYIVGITKSKEGSSVDVCTMIRTQNKDGVLNLIQNFFGRSTDIDASLKNLK